MSPGAIFHQQAYAQGKMLDHSGWHGVLPRGITPSDVDAVIESNGFSLLIEFSRHHSRWMDISTGQRILYCNFQLCCPEKILPVLAKHEVPSNRQINSRRDVTSFDILVAKSRHEFGSVQLTGAVWEEFVKAFSRQPRGVIKYYRDHVLESLSNG